MRHSGIAIAALPPAAQAQARALLATPTNGKAQEAIISPGSAAGPSIRDPEPAPGRKIRQRKGPRPHSKLQEAFLRHLRAEDLVAKRPREILDESLTLELANGCTYRPDVVVVERHDLYGTELVQLTAYEVKGKHAWDDAIVKLKVAARIYPWIRWYLATRPELGRWHVEAVYA